MTAFARCRDEGVAVRVGRAEATGFLSGHDRRVGRMIAARVGHAKRERRSGRRGLVHVAVGHGRGRGRVRIGGALDLAPRAQSGRSRHAGQQQYPHPLRHCEEYSSASAKRPRR